MNRKLPTGVLRDQFVKITMWDGMNAAHHMTCIVLKEASMCRWIIASQVIGTTQEQMQALTMALQAQKESVNESVYH